MESGYFGELAEHLQALSPAKGIMFINAVFRRNAMAFGLMRFSSLRVGSSTPGIGRPKTTPPHTVANSEISSIPL